MPGTRPGMTKTICVRAGLLERRCANGKTPLPPRACAIPRDPATLIVPAGESRESRRPFLATRAPRAADPHSVAGPDGWSRHWPLRLFAGAAGHARYAGLVVFRRRLHEYDQCRRLSRRCIGDVETYRALRAGCHRAVGNLGERNIAGAVRAVGQFFHLELCAAARGARRRGRLRGRRRAGGDHRAIAARTRQFPAQSFLRRTRARHPLIGAGRALCAAGFRAGIVVDRVVGDDAARGRHDVAAAAGTDR
jgi:hypothetical protein